MKNIIIIIFINLIFTSNLAFNGDNAFLYLKKQCEIGPRYPGSEGHIELVKYLQNHFIQYADSLEVFNDSIYHKSSICFLNSPKSSNSLYTEANLI